MQRVTLESIIKKYYLDGLIEGVKIRVKNKAVEINFIPTENKSLVGKITHPSMDLTDGDICIYNTSQLLKLLGILDHTIAVQTFIDRKVPLKLLLSDNEYDLEFWLADSNLISPVPKINEPPAYELEFDIDSTFVSKFIQAKKALGDIKQFTIEANQFAPNQSTIIVGDGDSYSNKIRYNLPIITDAIIDPIPFPASLFTEVLSANKQATGKIYLSKEGLMKIYFKDGDIESTYFLIRLE